jgi:hypothetical protein
MFCSILSLLLAASSVAYGQAKTFVVPDTEGADDAVAVRAALANFSSDSIILFEKGKTYSILTPLNFGTLMNVEIAIEGNITLPSNISEVQGTYFSSGIGSQRKPTFSLSTCRFLGRLLHSSAVSEPHRFREWSPSQERGG